MKELDDAFADLGVFYRRYMDDVIVMLPTRWRLRAAVKLLNRMFAKLKVEKHPNKTFVGRVAKGFDFLGYRVSPKGLAVSAATRARFEERVRQLYEQQRRGELDIPSPLGKYVRRWLGWVRAAGDVVIDINTNVGDRGHTGGGLLYAETQ